MSDVPKGAQTFEEALAQARHHQSKMVERRNVGLKIVIGIVTFDLLLLKFGLDAHDKVSDPSELGWAMRLVAVVAFMVMAGMLTQVELSNRRDRIRYRHAEARAEKIRLGEAPPRDARSESAWYSVRQSWATTWPLAGVLFLTVAIWWLAGLVR
jgi:hypothetical protein